MGLELLDSAAGKLVGDVLVEARLDDQNRTRTFAGHGQLLQTPVPRQLEAIALKPDNFALRCIRQQHHLMYAEIEQDLRADAIFDKPLLAATRVLGETRRDSIRP